MFYNTFYHSIKKFNFLILWFMHTIKELIQKIHALALQIKRPFSLMEVCGTHTAAIFTHGILTFVPESVSTLSGQ